MLAGRKPLAIFWEAEGENTIPDEAFSSAVRDGRIVRHEETVTNPSLGEDGPSIRLVLFALPAETGRIREALDILLPPMRGERKPTDRDDARLGRLLGYEAADIAAYTSRRDRPLCHQRG